MAEISIVVAEDLISKLQSERIPLHALLKMSSGADARISGFVDSKNGDEWACHINLRTAACYREGLSQGSAIRQWVCRLVSSWLK
jgi:hypothetical protein